MILDPTDDEACYAAHALATVEPTPAGRSELGLAAIAGPG
jgi:hypothetical protein